MNTQNRIEKSLIKYKYASFDIFDTLIIRKCGSAKEIFNLTKNKFEQTNHLEFDFNNIRIDAEKVARKSLGKDEITLEDIYKIIGNIIGNDIAEKLMEVEISIELEQCIANNKIVTIYNQFALTHDVYILSDMYLPEKIINQILMKNEIIPPKKIYISSEYQKTKRNRELYKLLLLEQNINKKELIHVGDNFISDYINPLLLGISSLWI